MHIFIGILVGASGGFVAGMLFAGDIKLAVKQEAAKLHQKLDALKPKL